MEFVYARKDFLNIAHSDTYTSIAIQDRIGFLYFQDTGLLIVSHVSQDNYNRFYEFS